MEKSGGGLPLPFAKVKLNKAEQGAVPVMSNIPLQPPPSVTHESKPCENDQEINYASVIPQNDEIGNSYEFVMQTLKGINESLASTDSSKVEEIDKRLNILEHLWTDGKIDDKLKHLLVKTAEGTLFR